MSRAERKEGRLDVARAIRKQEKAGERERIAETAKCLARGRENLAGNRTRRQGRVVGGIVYPRVVHKSCAF